MVFKYLNVLIEGIINPENFHSLKYVKTKVVDDDYSLMW